ALETARVEASRVDLDGVGSEVVGQADGGRSEPFREAEPERELLVVPRRAHRHRDRLVVDADLQRLLDREQVALELAVRKPNDLDGRRAVGRSLARRLAERHRGSVAPPRAGSALALPTPWGGGAHRPCTNATAPRRTHG